jgi:hypothetical protein
MRRADELADLTQNASSRIRRKRKPAPLRLALNRYRQFRTDGPFFVAGDWIADSNTIWDRPG